LRQQRRSAGQVPKGIRVYNERATEIKRKKTEFGFGFNSETGFILKLVSESGSLFRKKEKSSGNLPIIH
jgi:hypothetical protein